MKKPKFLPMENRQPADLADTSLTPKMVDEIAKWYRLGLRDSAVANMIGKSPHTLREWLIRGAMGTTNPLYIDLYQKCAKAVGYLETELISEIRVFAFGRPAEFAKKVTTHPDGSKTEEIQLDNDGQPIVIREEIKGRPEWVAWIMERRFRNEWSTHKDGMPVISTPDVVHNNVLQNKEADSVNFGVELSKEERLEMVELVKNKITTEGLVPNDK